MAGSQSRHDSGATQWGRLTSAQPASSAPAPAQAASGTPSGTSPKCHPSDSTTRWATGPRRAGPAPRRWTRTSRRASAATPIRPGPGRSRSVGGRRECRLFVPMSRCGPFHLAPRSVPLSRRNSFEASSWRPAIFSHRALRRSRLSHRTVPQASPGLPASRRKWRRREAGPPVLGSSGSWTLT